MSTETLVDDIYRMIDTKVIPKGVDVEEAIETFGENCKQMMRNNITESKFDRRKLRMSNIGKKDRQLWYNGIKGSMDCKIDGVLTDVKSSSPYGFKKFKDGSLINDDPFGYVDQIKGYAHSEKTKDVGWLVMDKTNGHLTYLKYDMEDESKWYWTKLNFFSIVDRIKNIKRVVKQAEPPKRCYEPVADGKSGNMKLAVGCSYCAYKQRCWGDELRTFIYSTGPRYLVKVENLPSVLEVDKDGNKISE